VKNSEIVSNTVAPDNMSITMTTSRTVPYYFLQLVGVSSEPSSRWPRPGLSRTPKGPRGLIPVGLPCTATSCSYTVGTEYQLLQAGTNGNGGSWNVGPGNWGRLALGAPGATQFENNLANGYLGSINVGDKVTAETGQVNGPTDEGVNIAHVDAGLAINGTVTNPTLATVPAYDPRLVAVPLIDFTGATGTSVQVTVMGFAMMWLDSYTSKGANKTLNAYFLGGTSHVGVIDHQHFRTAAPHPVAVRRSRRCSDFQRSGKSWTTNPTPARDEDGIVSRSRIVKKPGLTPSFSDRRTFLEYPQRCDFARSRSSFDDCLVERVGFELTGDFLADQ
jgi:hypothetical protein